MTRRWSRRPEGSNWGEYGEDDQLGRMNLLTPAHRREALAEVREGIAFTLSLPLDVPHRPVLTPNRRPPKLHPAPRGPDALLYGFHLSRLNPQHTDIYCDDVAELYTQYSTHWDSLAHVGQEFDADGDGYDEAVFYNGYPSPADVAALTPASEVRASYLGIENLAAVGVQGRGVLVDLARIAGVARESFGYDRLMRAFDAQGVAVEEGDFLCIYTGFADQLLAAGKAVDVSATAGCAVLDGTDRQLLDWITRSGVVAICADNFAVEDIPTGSRCDCRHARLPLHEHCLFKLGIHLGELWLFQELAGWLRQHGRTRFLLTAPPLRLPGAVGSPVTPIATV